MKQISEFLHSKADQLRRLRLAIGSAAVLPQLAPVQCLNCQQARITALASEVRICGKKTLLVRADQFRTCPDFAQK